MASVKVNKSGGESSRFVEPGSIRYANITLGEFIIIAYRLKRYQIAGPDWVVNSSSEDRYDIIARTSENVPSSEVPALLGPLLAERFKLQFHREMKDLPVYALSVAKNGPKLQPGTNGDPSAIPDGTGAIAFTNYPLDSLATLLSNTRGIGRPVVNGTGLTGKFTFRANFFDTPRDLSLTRVESNLGDGGDPATSPVFTNLEEQLGLKLEPAKLPTEMIVIDHVEKIPTEN